MSVVRMFVARFSVLTSEHISTQFTPNIYVWVNTGEIILKIDSCFDQTIRKKLKFFTNKRLNDYSNIL